MEMPPKQWTIADAQIDDASSLARMHAQSWRDTYIGLQPDLTSEWVEARIANKETPEGVTGYEQLIKGANDNPDKYLYRVAKGPNGEVLGFGSGTKTDDRQELSALYMDKSYHGSGVASAMADELMRWFDKSRDIDLTVAIGNVRAIKFYEKLGFVVLPETERGHDGSPELRVVTMLRQGDK